LYKSDKCISSSLNIIYIKHILYLNNIITYIARLYKSDEDILELCSLQIVVTDGWVILILKCTHSTSW